jgi:hypothetical protein
LPTDELTSWGGDGASCDPATMSCVVTMDADRSVSALFTCQGV